MARRIVLNTKGGSLVLRVPEFISEQVLYKEIGVQDVIGRRLLDFVHRMERIAVSNRELMFCARVKLESFTDEFLDIGEHLRRFIEDFAKHKSNIADVREARETVCTAFAWHIVEELSDIERSRPELPDKGPAELDRFRRRLAKALGVVRNELQKVFAYLLANDPRNVYREQGPQSQKQILFRQFRRDVEVTAGLYTAIRGLDRYMRGAIIPSDLLEVTAERIQREASAANILDSEEYEEFLNALCEEVLEQLLPELQSAINLEGVWYDDYENLQRKSEQISSAFIAFREQYRERRRLRDQVTKVANDLLVRDVFNRYGHLEIAERLRGLNQALVDLEGTLLQWERGVSNRAFAREEWREEEPLKRRIGGLVRAGE